MSLYVDIEKRFKDFHFSVQFNTGANITGILGASGSGKSMTLKCIAGIVRPDRGKIILNGRTLFDSERGINLKTRERRTGYLFQNYALFPNMTVRENILAGLPKKRRAKRAVVLESMRQLFRLEGLMDRKPDQISGGQQQRVALARIFAMEPEILMLDEPFSALDSSLKEFIQLELLDILQRYEHEVLMVSHSRDEIFRFCDDMVVIDEGHSRRQDSVKRVFADPQLVSCAKLIGIKNIFPCRKTDTHTVEVTPWGQSLTFREPVRSDTSYCAIRARSVELFETAPEDDTNVFRVAVERISPEFDRFSMVLTPDPLMRVSDGYHAEEPYIIVRIPRNRWRAQYKNTKYVRFKQGDLFQLRDESDAGEDFA
ncbi:MAG: ATP-binding cassette domain-containing protein [Eubacteriales bacterium]|nr:ATP-binding cassette domain-containing protein [Eubacteriales bacterium]